MTGYGWISLTTDYGLSDAFAASCHGVIARLAPEVRVIDVTHLVKPGDVARGAAVLAQAVPHLPLAVHVGVVDPGVGTARRGIVVQAARGVLVGPDNGLLPWAADALGGATAAVELTNRQWYAPDVSRTFHGRDIFSPAAAHVANGLALADLGPPIDPGALVRLELPQAEVRTNRIGASILYVDAFGNMQLNLTREHLDQADVQPGARLELELAGQRYYAIAARTFSDARTGDLILYEDSYGNVAVAMNRGNAAEMLSARAGQGLRIYLDAP